MRRTPSPATDDSGQIHVLEMVTLAWLFFMASAFIIQISIPDTSPIAADAHLATVGEDAWAMALMEPAVDSGNHSSLFAEKLSLGQQDEACVIILNEINAGYGSNCWLAKDGGPSINYGGVEHPQGRVMNIHHQLHDSGDLWLVSLQIWRSGGGPV